MKYLENYFESHKLNRLFVWENMKSFVGKAYCCLAVGTLLAVVFCSSAISGTPLDDYVKAADSSYKYTLLKNVTSANSTAYVLNMTSQRWLSAAVVSPSLWWHYVVVIKPNNLINNQSAVLIIDFGSNNDS